jgi:hypothetical protein
VIQTPELDLDWLGMLARLPMLCRLHVSHNADVDDRVFPQLADCKALTQLWLNNTSVTAEGLAHLRPTLQQVNVHQTNVTQRTLAEVREKAKFLHEIDVDCDEK